MQSLLYSSDAAMTDLTEREQVILFHVIDEFISSGEAVASSRVAKNESIQVSSATIRSVMSDLEERGLLVQPHTSAGRVPTAEGIRRYVDLLVREARESAGRGHAPAPLASPREGADAQEVARWASSILSDLTDLAGLVLGPDPNRLRIKEVRLVSLAPRRVLSVFVENDGAAVERVTTFEDPVDPADLIPMQNYLTELGRGRTLPELRRRVREELTETRTLYRKFMRQALALAHEASRDHRSDLHVEGAFRFVDYGDDLERVRDILRALEEKERVVEILDQFGDAPTPMAIIGPESGWALGDDLSFVICGYERGGDPAGLVGVIGPMRMDYARVIPLVDHVARVLSKQLEAGI